jgi:hypothetical protein
LIHDIAVWRNHERKGDGGRHERIEGGLQAVGVRGREQQVAIGRLFLLQELEHERLFLGLVLRNADQLDAAAAVHLMRRHEVRKFHRTRPAPSRPEVHDQERVGAVGA